jgi:hypothetical protein
LFQGIRQARQAVQDMAAEGIRDIVGLVHIKMGAERPCLIWSMVAMWGLIISNLPQSAASSLAPAEDLATKSTNRIYPPGFSMVHISMKAAGLSATPKRASRLKMASRLSGSMEQLPKVPNL